MIRITPSNVVVSPEAVAQLRAEFTETGCAMLPGFLAPAVLTLLLKQLKMARFEITDERTPKEEVFGTTLKMSQTEPAVAGLNFVLNRPALFALAAQIASSAPLSGFVGRLHRTVGGTDQHIDWHDDETDFRVVGLDVNLSAEEYEGGVFQIRGPERTVRKEISEWAPGDAFFFQIGNGWQHRLTPVELGKRTVGVGWFRSQPSVWTQVGSSFRNIIVTGEARVGDE